MNELCATQNDFSLDTQRRRTMAKKDSLKKKSPPQESKRAYVPQSKIPKMTLAEALLLPQGLNDNFASKPTAPHQLAMAVDISPLRNKLIS